MIPAIIGSVTVAGAVVGFGLYANYVLLPNTTTTVQNINKTDTKPEDGSQQKEERNNDTKQEDDSQKEERDDDINSEDGSQKEERDDDTTSEDDDNKTGCTIGHWTTFGWLPVAARTTSCITCGGSGGNEYGNNGEPSTGEDTAGGENTSKSGDQGGTDYGNSEEPSTGGDIAGRENTSKTGDQGRWTKFGWLPANAGLASSIRNSAGRDNKNKTEEDNSYQGPQFHELQGRWTEFGWLPSASDTAGVDSDSARV